MLVRTEAGQSLLEALIVVGVVLVATTIVTLGFHLFATNERPNEASLIALDAAEDAATELMAATAYDPNALAAVTTSQWQVLPASPVPGAPAADSLPIVLSLTVTSSGGTQSDAVVLHYSAGALQGNVPFTLRALTVPPGSVIDGLGSQ